MKRILVYILVTAAALLAPVERADVGKLLPVEVVCISTDGEYIRIETDTGDFGEGTTIETALQNLKDTSAGLIFLDTASYLLLREGAWEISGEMERYLKPWVRVCIAEGEIDLAEAAEYLSVHRPEAKLRLLEEEDTVEILYGNQGRMKIIEKSENNA